MSAADHAFQEASLFSRTGQWNLFLALHAKEYGAVLALLIAYGFSMGLFWVAMIQHV